jgi:hypothetical protein
MTGMDLNARLQPNDHVLLALKAFPHPRFTLYSPATTAGDLDVAQ